jgi:hypothetical protein
MNEHSTTAVRVRTYVTRVIHQEESNEECAVEDSRRNRSRRRCINEEWCCERRSIKRSVYRKILNRRRIQHGERHHRRYGLVVVQLERLDLDRAAALRRKLCVIATARVFQGDRRKIHRGRSATRVMLNRHTCGESHVEGQEQYGEESLHIHKIRNMTPKRQT